MLGSEFKQDKEVSKVRRGVQDSEKYTSYFLLSAIIFFRLYEVFFTDSQSHGLSYSTCKMQLVFGT